MSASLPKEQPAAELMRHQRRSRATNFYADVVPRALMEFSDDGGDGGHSDEDWQMPVEAAESDDEPVTDDELKRHQQQQQQQQQQQTKAANKKSDSSVQIPLSPSRFTSPNQP